MKARGSDVRFVTVSATVPNIDDVARWIGGKDAIGPARVFQVGPSSHSQVSFSSMSD